MRVKSTSEKLSGEEFSEIWIVDCAYEEKKLEVHVSDCNPRRTSYRIANLNIQGQKLEVTIESGSTLQKIESDLKDIASRKVLDSKKMVMQLKGQVSYIEHNQRSITVKVHSCAPMKGDNEYYFERSDGKLKYLSFMRGRCWID